MSIAQKIMSGVPSGPEGAWDLSYAYYDDPLAWDVSSASYSQNFSVAAQETFPQGLFFKPDGLKMYVIGITGDDVNEYDLSTAWDVSTASYSQNFSVAAQDIGPSGLFFKPDGLKMYVIGTSARNVNEYDLSTAWDVSTASYSQNFSVAAQENGPRGIFFKPDGLKMYVIGITGDDVNEYDLSTAWDVSSASYSQNFSVSAQETTPEGLFFKPDGLKMYIVGSDGDDVNEYDLSTAWDVSTASYSQNFSVAAQDIGPRGIFFKPDGLKMYIVGSDGDDVNEYDLGGFDVSGAELPGDVFFKPDGLRMYTVTNDFSSAFVNEYDLSTAWDMSTASFNGFTSRFNLYFQEDRPEGIFFKPDGTKMYIVGQERDAVREYDLSVAWQVNTASYLQEFSISAQDTGPQGLFFKPDGLKMYVVGGTGDAVYEYDLSTAWDVSTASYSQNFSVSAQETTPTGLFFKPDGLKMYVIGFTGDDVNEYDLSTAWDISTASYNQNFSVAAQETSPSGLFFKSDGTKMYVIGSSGVAVYTYTLGPQ